MNFLDDSLLPENQQPLVIQVAPYGPEFLPGDSDDIPLSMDEQVQKAVDCWNAGATVLHVHVREADGKGSKRLSMFNEMLARLRDAVPDMLLQVGGSISFAPEGEGADAKWLNDDTRHMLADLTPAPDQVTIAINTNQMNVCELLSADDVAGTSLALPAYQQAYTEMTIPSGPAFVAEHLRRLQAAGIQPHFMLGDAGQLETVERLIRRGIYTGPLVLNWVGIGGGADGPNPRNMMEFINRCPDNAVLTIESIMRNVLPLNTMAIAMGLHVRCGIEDNLWGRKGERMTSVQQIEQLVRISRELHREVATRAALRLMEPRRSGRIINIASVAGLGSGSMHSPGYSATKAAVISLTQTTAYDVAGANIYVNAIACGGVLTPPFQAYLDSATDSQRHSLYQMLPLGRLGQPEEYANVAVFLARDDHYLVGQVISPNGGYVI